MEIDIVAIDNDNKKLIVGECKYLNKPMKDSVFYNLIEKADSIKGYDDYDKVYVLFSLNGFEDRIMNINIGRNDLILFDNNK